MGQIYSNIQDELQDGTVAQPFGYMQRISMCIRIVFRTPEVFDGTKSSYLS